MTDKKETKQEVKPAPKRTFAPETIVRSLLGKSIAAVLTNPNLNPTNRRYILGMQEKINEGKLLTANEVAGLSKIERALDHVAKGTFKKVS